jgi:ATP-dependent Lon protease
MDIKPKEKQETLESVDLVARMDKIARLLSERIEVFASESRSASRPRRRSTRGSARQFSASR